MNSKMEISDIKVGMIMQTTFSVNEVAGSGFKFRARELNGRPAPKVVLCNDARIHAGESCRVRIVKIVNPQRKDRGAIHVEFVANDLFRIEGVYLDPVAATKLQVLLDSGLNILLDGPQGCGKTVIAKSIAETLGMEFIFFNCSAVVESTDFMATLQVRASETGHPVTDFIKTDLLEGFERAARDPGRRYLVFLDEFNRCQETARNALMPALDSTRRIFNPVDNRFISIPDNVQFIAAVNRGAEFSGTFRIDAAQLDRFAPLQMDYMPPREERALLKRRHPEIPDDMIARLVNTADAIRRAPEMSQSLSIRATEEACVYLKHPLIAGEQEAQLPEILKSSFCGRFSGSWQDTSSDAGAVWEIIARTLKFTGAKARLGPTDK